MYFNYERDDSRLLGASEAKGLSTEDSKLLRRLIKIRNKRLNKNIKRWDFYKDKNRCQNLGVEVPKEYKNMKIAVGWCGKAVDLLVQRSIYDGFSCNGEANALLDQTMKDNDFDLSYRMALPSELVYGCGFWTVTSGDSTPIVRYYNATRASAIWDYDKRNIKCGFVITDFDEDDNNMMRPCLIEFYTETNSIQIKYANNGWHIVETGKHNYGRPMMVSMSYRPDDDRPLGKSRISKACMSIQTGMQRELLRTEMHSDVFSVPHRYLLGANEEMFDQDKRKTYFQNLLLAERDENGDVPQYGQLPASSMQPHLDVMRNFASRFAAETSIPVHELGIIQDNPSSAEALYASMDSLCMEAENLNRTNGKALRSIAKMVFMVSGNKPLEKLTDEEKAVVVNWKNPYTPNIAAQTDAMVKQVAVAPYLTGTRDFWVNCGYSDEEAKRFVVMDRQYRAEQRANLLMASQRQTSQQEEQQVNTDEEVEQELKQ